ncbi:MAG: hypothetical protein GY862_33500 [Gammaproteobacteria bacterium]|nr:hypothetical protein [Gammaproteobacteria bacterium]
MNDNTQTDNASDGNTNRRIFNIPSSYDISALARELAEWLKSDRKMETGNLAFESGWLVQARDTDGKLTRLVKRKAESLHVRMLPDGNHLTITLANGKWAEDRERERKFSLRNIAGFAIDTATDLTDRLVETKTADAIFDFVAKHIVGHFKAIPCGIEIASSRYVEPMTCVESVWVAGFCGPDEIPLAWLQTSTEAPDEAKKEEWRYLLTSCRAALAAFSTSAFLSVKELPCAPMSVSDVIGRDTVTVEEFTWRTQLFNDTLFQEISPLSQLAALEERLGEAARLNFIHANNDEKILHYAASVLDHVLELSDTPLNRLSRIYVELARGKAGNAKGAFDEMEISAEFIALMEKFPDSTTQEQLSQWAESWRLSAWERVCLAGLIQEPASPAHAKLIKPLLEQARDALIKEDKNKNRHILADIFYAQNLGLNERRPEAVLLLKDWLPKLPDESFSDLLPSRDADLTKGEGGQIMKIRILEVLAELRGFADKEDIETLMELASLQPLALKRLKKLYEAGDEAVRERVSSPLRLLEKNGPALKNGKDTPAGKVLALLADDIETKLKHPASRKGTSVSKLQNFLAAKNVPDQSALKSYAKRVTPQTEPELAAALMDGALLLGMPAVEGFISFGKLSTGIRGHEGQPSFILIGSEHLDSASPYWMTSAELRFLIGAELAHIKFKHARITSREIWEGVFDKAMFVVNLVPILGSYLDKLGKLGKFAGHAADAAGKIAVVQAVINHARKAAASAQNIFRRHPEISESSETLDEQNLISAFRAMQLTADRAALMLCGDLKPAVRAIFKSSLRLNPELPMAEQLGLDLFLSRTDDKGELMFQEPAIRIAALFSFYLSKDYEILTG